MPNSKIYTFWGKGVSQGHSDAIRRLKGIKDARQYTEKIQALDPRVDKVCQAIDLLAQTYQKAIDKSLEIESDVAQNISNINSNY